MGAKSICIKDMANLLLPYEAYDLVKATQGEASSVPIHLHTHNTSGTGDMVLPQGDRGGRGHRRLPRCPRWRNGTSQPATESLVATLHGTEYDTGLDLDKL